MVEILARRDVAQREGLADHGRRFGRQARDALQRLVAQATLEKLRGERRAGAGRQAAARFFGEWHCYS
jgi:hypothetical protein